MTLLIATTNTSKLREIRELLGGIPVRLLTLADAAPVPEPDESGLTFAENARLKARYYDREVAARLPEPVVTVAEDSGLVIDALDGEPGVQSARFLRPDATYAERFEEIAKRLAARPGAPRTARFVCAIPVARAGDVIYETQGTVEGEIAAFELSRFYGGGLKPQVGKLITVDLLESQVQARKVLKVPRCIACSPLNNRSSVNPYTSPFIPSSCDGL